MSNKTNEKANKSIVPQMSNKTNEKANRHLGNNTVLFPLPFNSVARLKSVMLETTLSSSRVVLLLWFFSLQKILLL